MDLVRSQRRIDAGTLARPVRRADGSMVVQAKIARTGVQIYRNLDGSRRREYRPASEVGAPEALASLKLIPFTIYHPPTMVTAANATQYSRGTTGENVTFDGKWVDATIAVQAKDAVDALAYMTQISVGYDCDLEMTAGVTPEGEHYDCIQRNIRGNHVALVPDARAGAEAAVRMDAACSEPDPITPHKDQHMDTAALTAALTKALGDVATQTARADALTTRVTALEHEVKTASGTLAKVTAERDVANERADTAEKSRVDAVNANPARVRERVQLEGNARKVLGKRCDRVDGKDPELDLDALGVREIQLAVIKHVTNVDAMSDLKGKDDAFIAAYVAARYDAALERATASADTFRENRAHIERGRNDSAQHGESRSKRNQARADMVDHNRKGGIPEGANGDHNANTTR